MFFHHDNKNEKNNQTLKLNFHELSCLKLFTSNQLPDSYITNNQNLQTIIKLADNNVEFEKYCTNPKFKGFWQKSWTTAGALLSFQKYFYSQDNIEGFDLVRGFYFYYQALNTANNFKQNFTSTEIGFLKKGIKYHSVHAAQRYIDYCNQQISLSSTPEKLHLEIIHICKDLTKFYGSYAYMMLAEAQLNYGIWLNQNQNFEKSKLALNALLECRELAYKNLRDSESVIFNASLGQGLGKSNTLNICNPKEFPNQSPNENFFLRKR